jgi:predicted phage-related endonuclease
MTSTETKTETQTEKVELKAKARKALTAFVEAKQIIKEAEEVKAQAEKEIREALGNALVATINGFQVLSVAFRKRTNVNAKKLEAKFPGAFEATKYIVEYDFLNVIQAPTTKS